MWNLKKEKTTLTDIGFVVYRRWRRREGELDEGGQKVHTSSYKMNKGWGCDAQHGDCSQHCCVAYLKARTTTAKKK